MTSSSSSPPPPLLKSRLARRLVLVFVLLIGLPLVIAVFVVGRAGREQILWTARTLERINHDAVAGAGDDFQRLGGQALTQSSQRTSHLSLQALRSTRRRLERVQNEALETTAREVEAQTRHSLDEAARRSLQTSRAALARVNEEMTALFARSSQNTQRQAGARVQRAMLDLIGDTLRERAERLAFRVSQHVETHANYLHPAAQIPALRTGQAADQKTVVDALVRRYAMFTTVSVLDAQGRETALAASNQVFTASDRGDRANSAYFQAALRGETFLLPEAADATGAPVLRLAVPIEAYQGRVVGVLAARLSLADLWDVVRSTRIGEQGFACVTADAPGNAVLLAPPRGGVAQQRGPLLRREALVPRLNWRVIAAQPQRGVMQPIRALERDIQANTQRALGQMKSDIERSGRSTAAHLRHNADQVRQQAARRAAAQAQSAFARLKEGTARQMDQEVARLQRDMGKGAAAAQRLSRGQMASAARAASREVAQSAPRLAQQALHRADARLSRFALVLGGVSCLVGSLIALLLARRIVRPVLLLAQNTRAIANGNLSGRVSKTSVGRDEIGDLAQSFNTMAASLEQSRADLEGAQTQLVQAAKLASLGTLSAGIAHELNQPVAIIRGLAQQLQDEPDLPAVVASDLSTIEGQTGRMIKIIKHLRTFSRAGGGVGADDAQTLDPNRVLRDCFILLDAQLKDHNIVVELDLCLEKCVVAGDANELEQVFLNLITNARDALDNRADARLAIRSHVGEDGRFVIAFADNGPGVPGEMLARLFDPFFTTKEVGKGTGLGLSISHGIVKKMGGTLVVASNHGAVFTLTLPLLAAAGDEPLLARAA